MGKPTDPQKTPVSAVTSDIPAMDIKVSDCKSLTEPIAEEAEPERGNWTGRFDFLLSLLGYSVGLGNVWRFPYLCYNNGGGAFLIPFTIMLIIAGLPLMFMELSFGQYAALGPVAVYNKFCPLFQGLGYGMVIVSSIVMLYYNLIIAWTIYYMTVSFMSIFYTLPWQNCDAEWSTIHCYSYEEADSCEAINGTYYLRQCYNQSYAMSHNLSALAAVALRKPPAEEYFTNQVLGLSSGIEETGQIRWGMAACLFAAWLIVFLCLCKGVQSSGKVVYFTALFPYVVLVILFFRGVTLPGAMTGILFYLTPDFSRLANAQVWGDAAVQIFFALSPAWGGLITLSSYNKFSNNCYIDSLIVAVSNIATSFFAGLVIFSVIGFLAHELNVNVGRVVDQGAGLAFIVYPEVVTRLPVSPLWSILFFVMLLTLGLDSQFALMETVTTAILDRFPNFRQKKVWVVLTVAVFGYFGGLIFTTNSGMYWLQLMDKYAANWSVLIIAIGECIIIAWIYGAEKFCRDIQRMIGDQSKLWVFFWTAMWRLITPAALVFILVFNWIEYRPASYGQYVYPMWADAVGWTLGVLPVVVVVLMAVDQICSGPDDLTIMETSQDGGDSISITSGLENEFRKSAAIIKTKRNSIKRKVANFSNESDEAVIEPLLQKDKDRSQTSNQSANYNILLTKTKTEDISEKMNDKEKTIANEQMQKISTAINPLENKSPSTKENTITKSSINLVPVHNHMNTNIFSINSGSKGFVVPKSQILVEIDETKSLGYNPSPLIFTTAKIHTDGKTKQMEPVQVTPVPILSTTEMSAVKIGDTLNKKDITGVNTNVTTMFVNSNKHFGNITVDNAKSVKAPIVTTKNITPLSFKNVSIVNPNAKVETSGINMKLVKDSDKSMDNKDVKNPILGSKNIIQITSANSKTTNDDKIINNKIQTGISQAQSMDSTNLENKTGSIPFYSISVTTGPSQYAIKDNTKQSKIDDNILEISSETMPTKGKADVAASLAPRSDLSKDVKRGSIVEEIRSDNSVAAIDSTNTGTSKGFTNNSVNNKLLQRQNNPIATYSLDSSFNKKSDCSQPLSKESKYIKSDYANVVPCTKITTQVKPQLNEVSVSEDKSKLPLAINTNSIGTNIINPIVNASTTSSITKTTATYASKSSKITSSVPPHPPVTFVSSEPVRTKSSLTSTLPVSTSNVMKPESTKTNNTPPVSNGIRSISSPGTSNLDTTKALNVDTSLSNKITLPTISKPIVSVTKSITNKTTPQPTTEKSAESTIISSAASNRDEKHSKVKNINKSTNSVTSQPKAMSTNITKSSGSIQKIPSIKKNGDKSHDSRDQSESSNNLKT